LLLCCAVLFSSLNFQDPSFSVVELQCVMLA
jgi:hypothetical protein